MVSEKDRELARDVMLLLTFTHPAEEIGNEVAELIASHVAKETETLREALRRVDKMAYSEAGIYDLLVPRDVFRLVIEKALAPNKEEVKTDG
jgi:chromosomal replication initiation ATPase DnaA